jgi:gas vesicle protein
MAGCASNCNSSARVLPSELREKNLEVRMSERDSNSFLWFLAGLGFGAIAGVLYAPRSGSETREALRSRAEEGRDFVRDRTRQARDQATGWADRGREILNQQKEQFKSAYEAGKQAYQEATHAEGGGTSNP